MTDRRPRAFRLDENGDSRHDLLLTEQPDAYALEAEAALAAARAPGIGNGRRGFFSWGGLFWSSLGSLVALGIGLWGWNLVVELLQRNPALGVVAAGLAGLALLALLVIAIREIRSLHRLDAVTELREAAAVAHAGDDTEAARAVCRRLRGLSGAPELTAARAELASLEKEIVDGADLLRVAERLLVAPQDAVAKAAIAAASKRVSLITAISPRAVLDLAVVLAQSVRLVRRIAEAYGGRPSALGALKLAREVVSHLTLTGGMAIGDSLVSQVVGVGLAARLSTKLGEGVINGLLTARVGLAAIEVCRPLPFIAETPPALGDVAGSLFQDRDATAKTAG